MMAKGYNCTWPDITSLNIITFNHKLKFLEHYTKEIEKSHK